MALRVCIEANCPELTRTTRCTEHERARDAARGTPTERGYGPEHRALRARYQRRMDGGRFYACWRCGGLIDPSNWTLGHCDDDRSHYHGPECPPCDYATSGRGSCPHPNHN